MSNLAISGQRALSNLKHQQEKKPVGDSIGTEHHTAGGDEPPGGTDVKARVAKLESHFEYIRRDLDSVATDVKELRKDMREEFKAVRGDMQDIRADMQADSKALRSEMREDLRMLFGSIVAVALGMAGLMAKAFGWL